MTFEQDHQQCLAKLQWAMHQLQIDVGETALSRIADLIVQTMTGRWRYFHTPEHIFAVGGEDNPIEVLAALFHDVVYVQVDKSVNFNLSYYIVPFVHEIRDQLFIRHAKECPPDRLFEIILALFGFVPGQPLSPFAGQNEFLSAIVGAKALENFLSLEQLVAIIVCIETTIPFRPANGEGLHPADQLFLRLQGVNLKYQLGLDEARMITMVQQAVRMANRDVGSFANPSPARFLDGTWSLLPETNHNLHNRSSYTVAEYRLALQKMEGFMAFLKPELIFQQFQREPTDAVYQQLIKQSEHNLAVGRLYLGSKLFTMGILEALSLRIGRDIPLSSMMGELPSYDGDLNQSNLIDFIPDIENRFPLKDEIEQEVLDLLDKGRHQDAAYDLKNSPLTTFIVKAIGFDNLRRQRDRAKDFFQGHLSAEQLLNELDPEVIELVTQGICRLFEQRKSFLLRLTTAPSGLAVQ